MDWFLQFDEELENMTRHEESAGSLRTYIQEHYVVKAHGTMTKKGLTPHIEIQMPSISNCTKVTLCKLDLERTCTEYHVSLRDTNGQLSIVEVPDDIDWYIHTRIAMIRPDRNRQKTTYYYEFITKPVENIKPFEPTMTIEKMSHETKQTSTRHGVIILASILFFLAVGTAIYLYKLCRANLPQLL